MQIEPSIFKAYDIRGTYPQQINETGVYAIARAFAAILVQENPGKKLTIAVGADMRTSSPALKGRVIAGLTDSGLNVVDIGLVSTPTFYFGVAKFGYDGGIQVSASHNPKEWNGMKMVRRGGVPVSKNSGIMEMLKMITEDNLPDKAANQGTVAVNQDVIEAEIADQTSVLADLEDIKPMKIAVDASNAMGGVDIAALFAKLPQIEVVKMNFELDGNFPAHPADPMDLENTAMVRQTVVEKKCDLGIAPDGDGDRYFFIDEKGEMLPQAILRGIMAQIELREHPGALVAYDMRPGKITQDMIDEYGGRALVTPVGHSLIKEEMLKHGAIFGGESSGHYFYKRPYGVFEMPIILVLKLLQYISEAGKPFSEVIAPFKRYAHSGEINVKVGSRDEVLEKIAAVKARYADGKQILIDGLTVEYPDFWFNLRGSNTEPLLRFTIEANDPKVMAEKRDEVLALLGEKVRSA